MEFSYKSNRWRALSAKAMRRDGYKCQMAARVEIHANSKGSKPSALQTRIAVLNEEADNFLSPLSNF